MTAAGRLGFIALLALGWTALAAPPARADPAGPSDFETSVERIEPDVGRFTVEIIGGDSFILLTVEPGTNVDIVGYRGEPYLRFDGRGRVEQNDRSPSTYLNEDRYAAVDIPPEASPDAEPQWRTVATDGSFAWHDHRAHWMNEAPPPGRGPGEVILEGVIPLTVNGTEVDVTVISTWQPAPARAPVAIGLGAGLLLGLLAWRSGLRRAAALVVATAAVALGIGVVAFLAVPAETAPSHLLWLLPSGALALGTNVAIRSGNANTADAAHPLLLLIAAMQLALWGWLRWDWLWRAILPTNTPFWLDRLGTAIALTGGLALAAAVVAGVAAGRPGGQPAAGRA